MANTVTGNTVPVVQKSPLQSKTMWVNVITFVSLLGVILAGVKLTAGEIEIVGAVVAAANVGLRLITGSPVTATGASLSAPRS